MSFQVCRDFGVDLLQEREKLLRAVPLAPLFPALVAGVAALIPVDGHFQFAKGALIATMGVAAFVVLLVILMFVGAGLR